MDKKFAQNPLAPACDHPGDHQRFPSPRFANWSDPTSVNSGPDLWANQNCWKFTFGFRGTSDIPHPPVSQTGEPSSSVYNPDATLGHWFNNHTSLYAVDPREGQNQYSTQLVPSPSRSSTVSSSTPHPDVPEEKKLTHKKRPMDSDSSSSKPSGACTRCKRLKMKCSFPDSFTTCARCLVGGHECVVLGRKQRSPGTAEILRKKIRQKDAEIDDLLNQLNPTPSLATPLSLIPSRLALTEEQRSSYKAALSWLEKPQSGSKGQGSPRTKVDISTLDDTEMDSDEDAGDGEAGPFVTMGPLLGTFAPAGILVKTAMENRMRGSADATSVTAIPGGDNSMDRSIEAGVGSRDYFQPGPAANLNLRRLIIERQAAPDILLSGLITFADAEKLFEIFYKWINPFIPVLDENIHTTAAVLGRCPFLFTVAEHPPIVCALSSRYFPEKPELFGLAIHLAKAAAASNFLDGWKTLEMCQAYLLLGAYAPPARRWEEDRSWFYTGLAFRLAIELNLNQVPDRKATNERAERELLNRFRTWIICYLVDRLVCTNLGKPFMIPEDEAVINAEKHFLGFTYQRPGDTYLVSLVELLRLMTRFREKIQPAFHNLDQGLTSELELLAVHKVVTEDFMIWKCKANERCEKDSLENSSYILHWALMESVHQFCCLVTLSSGLQYVNRSEPKGSENFVLGCLDAATEVIKLMLDRLIPSGFAPYCPEQVFVFTGFAAASLIKLLRPEYSDKVMGTKRTDAVELLKRLRISLDDERSGNVQEPRQRYADFLRNILKPHLFEPNSMKKEEEEEESSGSRHHHRRSSSNGSSASTTTKEVVYNHSDDQNPIPASNDHVVHPSTNEWSQLPSDFNFLPFHEEWTSQNVIPYATESPNFAPSGTNYLSSMMNSASQFWFQ